MRSGQRSAQRRVPAMYGADVAAAATKAAYAPKCADRVCQVWLSLCSQIVLSRIHINMTNKRTEIVDKSFAR